LRDRLPKAIDAAPASPADSLRDDLVSALVNLGYHRQAIDASLDKLLSSGRSDQKFETVLRSALKELSRS
jgi:Holliday junction resolvasome RuvABC DNA-binding subunit